MEILKKNCQKTLDIKNAVARRHLVDPQVDCKWLRKGCKNINITVGLVVQQTKQPLGRSTALPRAPVQVPQLLSSPGPS